jgi:succinoglycan biosynthesis protein ExoL
MRRSGFLPHAYSFCRSYYLQNRFPNEIPVVNLGEVPSGGYLKRLVPLVRALSRIRNCEIDLADGPVIKYGFGLDCAMLARCVAGGVPLVYEVGDLRVRTGDRSLFGRFFHRIEQSVLRHAALLVTTAPAFVTEHFVKSVPGVDRKAIVIENRIPSDFPVRRPAVRVWNKTRRRINLGIIGFLRYPKATLPFVSEVARRPDSYCLSIHGDGPMSADLRDIAARSSNISFFGPFRNPDDLDSIYSDIDLSYVVYDNENINVRLAIPNKFYESLFFCKPLIVAEGTELAERVLGLNVGVAVDPQKDGFCIDLLDRLSLGQVADWSHACFSVPAEQIIEDENEFLRALNSLWG